MVKARTMATCAMISALCVVLMILGGILELGMYAAPMIAGLCMIPIGRLYGTKYQTMVWVTVSLLSFMLVPHIEQNLIFAAFFGWYPIARPKLDKLPKGLGFVCKILIFNIVIIAVESLVMLVLVPEAMESIFLILLLVLANVTFVMYDFVIPKIEIIFLRAMKNR